MRKVKHDEKITNSIVADVDNNTVTTTFTVKADNKRETQKYVAEGFVLGFEGVTPAELMTMASRSIIIGEQRKFRDADNAGHLAIINTKRVSVRMVLDAERRTADPKVKARNAIAKLDKATREALLKEYSI